LGLWAVADLAHDQFAEWRDSEHQEDDHQSHGGGPDVGLELGILHRVWRTVDAWALISGGG